MRDEYIFQHYVPRMHLEKFSTNSSEPKVWVFDKPSEKQFLSSLDNIAGENFFYDPADIEDPKIESLLENVEKKAGNPYQKIIDEASLSALSDQEKADISLFLSLQFNRTRERRNSLIDTGKQLKEALKERGIDDHIPGEELEPLGTEESAQKIQNQTLIESTTQTAKIFVKKTWTLLVNRTNIPFCTSDHPLSLHNQRDFGPFRGDLGIENQGIEIYFPISPEYMLVLLDPEDFGDIYAKMPVYDTDEVNHINSLQVSQSTRQIFSTKEEFGFVRDIIDENPELKNPDRKRGEVL